MSAIFVIPKKLTFVSGSTATTPATHLLLDEPGLAWRSTNLTSVFTVFQTDGTPYDVVALVGSNLRANDTIRIRGAATAAATTTAPVFDQTVSIASGTAKKLGSLFFHKFAAPASAAFIRVDYVATGHPDGHVRAARLVVGQSRISEGLDAGVEISYDNASRSYLNPVRTTPTWKLKISGLNEAAYWGTWDQTLLDLNEYSAFLLIPDSDGAYIQRQAVFGRYIAASKTVLTAGDWYEVEMTVSTII